MIWLGCSAAGCSFDSQAAFGEPVLASSSARADGGSASTSEVGEGGAGTNAGSAGTNAGGAGTNAGGAGVSGGGALAGSGGSGTSGSAGDGSSGATTEVACSGVAAWSERAYVMGERATAICKSPYNGSCAIEESHEFECRPATGVVGLGWCKAREPGVINGWQEAWLLRARCL